MPVKLTRRIRDFTDISLSFQANPVTKDITLLKNERAIQNALKNCIMISTKSVAFTPDFGSVVNESLFELNDSFALDDIKKEVERSIAYNEPRVEVIDVQVDTTEDAATIGRSVKKSTRKSKVFYENFVRVSVKYKIIGYLEIFNTEYILTPTSTP
jgi:phage baseplate assembly protein W